MKGWWYIRGKKQVGGFRGMGGADEGCTASGHESCIVEIKLVIPISQLIFATLLHILLCYIFEYHYQIYTFDIFKMIYILF